MANSSLVLILFLLWRFQNARPCPSALMNIAQLPSYAYLQTFTTLAPTYVVGPADMDAPVLKLNFAHICLV
jgi:hypothetical protein